MLGAQMLPAHAMPAAPPGAANVAELFDSGALGAKSPAAPGQQPGAPLAQPTIRSEFADTALWVASLETNKNGIAEAEFDMPQNLTAWKIRALGLGPGTRVG